MGNISRAAKTASYLTDEYQMKEDFTYLNDKLNEMAKHWDTIVVNGKNVADILEGTCNTEQLEIEAQEQNQLGEQEQPQLGHQELTQPGKQEHPQVGHQGLTQRQMAGGCGAVASSRRHYVKIYVHNKGNKFLDNFI